jgi:hypothetical protein
MITIDLTTQDKDVWMRTKKKIRMPQIRLLERLFECEISGQMYQSKSKKLTELMDDGMVQPREELFPSALGKIQCAGWELTNLGRITYCEWAATQPMPEDEQV